MAERELNKIQECLEGVIIEAVFPNKTFQKPLPKVNVFRLAVQAEHEGVPGAARYKEKYTTNQLLEANDIKIVLVLPAYTEVLCSEVQELLGLILT